MNVRPNVYRVKKIEPSSNRRFWLVYVDAICCGEIFPTVIICDSQAKAHAVKVGDEIKK